LSADLEAALKELAAPLEGRPELWNVGPAGKWSAGQIVDHVARWIEGYAGEFAEALLKLKAGTLGPRRLRWPHQRLICAMVIDRGIYPSGGKSLTPFLPGDLPRREETMAKLSRAVAAHGEISGALSATDRDRLWIANPVFGPLNLPEAMRLHAVHARHHGRQVHRIRESAGP
jgi:hypothetical protein